MARKAALSKQSRLDEGTDLLKGPVGGAPGEQDGEEVCASARRVDSTLGAPRAMRWTRACDGDASGIPRRAGTGSDPVRAAPPPPRFRGFQVSPWITKRQPESLAADTSSATWRPMSPRTVSKAPCTAAPELDRRPGAGRRGAKALG